MPNKTFTRGKNNLSDISKYEFDFGGYFFETEENDFSYVIIQDLLIIDVPDSGYTGLELLLANGAGYLRGVNPYGSPVGNFIDFPEDLTEIDYVYLV